MFSFNDVRHTLRTWWLNTGPVFVGAFSLALGIGANTTMFSAINAIQSHSLPFEDSDRLAVLWNSNLEQGIQRTPPSFEMISALLENGSSFEDFGFFQGGPAAVTLSGDEQAVRVSNHPIDSRIFRVLGVEPMLGRTYSPSDLNDLIKIKEVRPIVISHETWQGRFESDPDAIGQTLRIDGAPRTVIGVMPSGFTIAPWIDNITLWAANDLDKVRAARWMYAVGRLRPGVTLEQAAAEADPVIREIIRSRGEDTAGWTTHVETLHDAFFGEALSALFFLLGAVSFVLLIACANVANLQLARGASRQKELAIRASVGAGRARLVRQLLTESVLLALLGGGLGCLLAVWGNRVFAALVPAQFPQLLRNIEIDSRVLAFTLLISVVSGIAFGLVPALQASRVDLNSLLKEGGRGSGKSGSGGRFALLVSEISLSMVLLLGAGVMMIGFLREQSSVPGFDTENLLTVDILLGGDAYFQKLPNDRNSVSPLGAQFFERLLQGVESIPGVRSAGLLSRLPLRMRRHPFTISGRDLPEVGHEPTADFCEVSPRLFETLGLPLIRGRSIEERDRESSSWVVVINRSFADRFFENEDPIGRHIQISIRSRSAGISVKEPQMREVVGIVGDVSYPSRIAVLPAAMYVPYRQHLREYSGGDQGMHLGQVLVLRTSMNPATVSQFVRGIVEQVDADQAPDRVLTMDQRIAGSQSVSQGRFLASVFGLFGGLAILLAMVGIYGVMSYVVTLRSAEFGIRGALGATRGDLVVLLLRQLMKPTSVGVAMGLGGGIALTRLLSSAYSGLSQADPSAFVGVTLLMVGAALLAALLPARRASQVDPLEALKCE